MERSRKRTPIIHRSKGACTIGLVLAMGFAVFGVGGAAAGDGTYARHAREQRLAGIALAHRTAEQLVLAMKPHTSTTPATDPVTTPPAPAATVPTTPSPAPATTPQPAATTTATTPAPTDTTTTTATTPAPTDTTTTTATTPAPTDTTTTTATTPAPTDTTTTTATTPAPTDTTTTTATTPAPTDTTTTTTDPTTTDPTTTDPSAIGANPSAQVGSSGSGAVCYGRCVTSGQTSAVPSAVPSSTTPATSGNFSLTSSPLATTAPTTGTVTPTAPVNAVSSTTLGTGSTGTQNNTPSASTTPPLRSGLKNLTSPSSLLKVTHGNSTTKRSGTGAPVGSTGTAASGGATGGATAAAAGTLVASTAATGTGSGSHGATTKHSATKHPSSGGSGITAPFSPAATALVKFVNHIPTAIWVALGAACALALAFAALAYRSGRRARKQERHFAAISAAAQTDALTGIFNRRGFMDAAERELARASRYDRQFVLAYVDVRGLKAVNDTEGHLMGDELIKAVAGLMKESARADDVVGRIGGDEFALLLGEQTAEGAEPVLRRIRARVEERRSGMEIRVPWELTIGIAAFPDDGTTLEELLGVADRRLYEQRGIALR